MERERERDDKREKRKKKEKGQRVLSLFVDNFCRNKAKIFAFVFNERKKSESSGRTWKHFG